LAKRRAGVYLLGFSMRYKWVSLRRNNAPSVTAGEALKVPFNWFVAKI
jgi:hypothetical protein